ncbi:MAG TPA: class I SAM-dependent methyltransferase [Sphingomicrobium sp.]|jgi:SAM-dependent methyltransferase|nr:class I SAM-dependent methyltransferase [Sphingomicrobium sp.]
MERAAYREMADLDQRHWWYRARRQILQELIRREVRPPRQARILEIGCGTGHNLEMLGQFGEVDAIELDDESRAIAQGRLGRDIVSARLPELTGIPERHYDLIAALDVIEHIDGDGEAIAAISSRLKAGGKFLMTVPAHPWMWSAHDTVNHHKRRYSKASLKRLIDGSPLRPDKIGYFNSLLFPFAVADRLVSKLRGKDDAEVKLPSPPLNSGFEAVFAAERHFVGRLPLPPGLSLFAVASAR